MLTHQEGVAVPTKFAGPWEVISIGPDDGWMVVHAIGSAMSMWRATREIAQALADDENQRWRQRRVEEAAPDMLTALLTAEKYIGPSSIGAIDAMQMIRAAIAKATGATP